MNRRTFLHTTLAAATAFAFFPHISFAADAQRLFKDTAHVEGGHEQQRLDIYLPANPRPHPFIIFVHGGAWRACSKKDMPQVLIHGDADPRMPIEQSRELDAACRKARRSVEFTIMPGSVHGGREFFNAERIALVEKFLREHLK